MVMAAKISVCMPIMNGDGFFSPNGMKFCNSERTENGPLTASSYACVASVGRGVDLSSNGMLYPKFSRDAIMLYWVDTFHSTKTFPASVGWHTKHTT